MKPRITHPILLTLDNEDIRLAVAAARCSTSDRTWQRRIDDAEKHMSAAKIAFWQGTFYLTSPVSGNTYQTTTKACPCTAHARHGNPCWHRAAIRLVQRIWQAYSPRWQCPYCAGPMFQTPSLPGHTACLVCETLCEHTALLKLTPWPQAGRVHHLPRREYEWQEAA